ncbi:DUF6493 family protein [Actinoplanes solisilvae]|uniref:DUF6493 family protein n=1 Tax=Actinoplanes solisilvae TaxID=2486853 RepID=UPI000FD87CBA|nr:DUF6493 family protein [Actinoplanes solisilvae]
MSLTWQAIDKASRSEDIDTVTTMLLKATEEQRLAVGKELAEQFRTLKPETWWQSQRDPAIVYGLAMLGTAPSAAKATALLSRRDMREKWGRLPMAHIVRVVRARDLPWLGDLALRLAGKLRVNDSWSRGWLLVATLLTESGTPAPPIEGVVRGWLREFGLRNSVPLIDQLRDSPHLDVLLPALFEIDGIGSELDMSTWDFATQRYVDRLAFPEAVARLVTEGRLDRKTILTATVDRLVRDDRPVALRPFTALHDELAPDLDELTGHALDYAGLLPGSPSPVAGLAQRALRTVDDAGRLELDTLLDTSRATLVRKEKTLVKTQLSWLDKVARRETDRTGEVLETIAAAFDHPALDLQDRALTIIERQSARLDADALARLREAAAVLGGDLPARAAKTFGAAEPMPVFEAALTPSAGPATMPPPMGSLAELAEELAILAMHEQTAVGWERILAGLVELRFAADKTALAEAYDQYSSYTFSNERWRPREHALGAAIRRVLEPSVPEEKLGEVTWLRLVDMIRGTQPLNLESDPTRLLTLRLAEIAVESENPVPALMATPTHVNGNLDAAVLVERLRRAEAEGWEPAWFDFEQALLRLPRGTSPAVAEGLTSPAGRRLADWLAGGGLPDPVSARREQKAGQNPRRYWDTSSVLKPSLGSEPKIGRIVVTLTPSRPGLLSVVEPLLSLSRGPVMSHYPAAWHVSPDVLAATLPHHREVSAAWLLPNLASLADQDLDGDASLLPVLADCDGPVGPAISLGLAYALAARQESDRAAAVDLFLALAAESEPFAPDGCDPGAVELFSTAVGRDLADLAGPGLIKLGRAVPSLADALNAGAAMAVWATLVAAVPRLLAHAPRGLPDLMQLACRAAAAVGARDEIPGLSEVAARKGSTRLLQEARRLQAVLMS